MQILVRTCVLVDVLRRSKNVEKPRPYVIVVDRMAPNYLIFLVCRCRCVAQIAKKFARRTDRLTVVFFADRITAQLPQVLAVEVRLLLQEPLQRLVALGDQAIAPALDLPKLLVGRDLP